MKNQPLPTHAHTSAMRRFCLFATLACALIASAVTSRAALTDGLVSYWSMDTTNLDNTVSDISFTNHMSMVGPIASVAGQFSNALSFNGTSTWMTNFHASDRSQGGLPVFNAGSYTIAMWVKGAAQTARFLYTEGNITNNNPIFAIQSGNAAANNSKLDVLIRNDRAQVYINHPATTNVVFNNAWHHIAVVDDRGSVKIYIDGVVDPVSALLTYPYRADKDETALNTACIGNLVRLTAPAAAGTFSGQMDEVGTWERALSLDEVNQVRTNGVYSQGVPVPARAAALVKVPANVTNSVGSWRVLSVDATGNPPMTYQWSSNGIPLAGATSRSIQIVNLQPNNTGDFFSCAVTNPLGFAITTNATMTVVADPTPDLTNGLVNYWPLDYLDAFTNAAEKHFGNYFRMVNLDAGTQLLPGQFSNSIFCIASPTPGTFGIRTGGSPIYNRTNYTVSLWVNGNGTSQADRRVFSEGRDGGNNNPLFTLGTDNAPAGFTATPCAYPFIRSDTGVNSPIVGRTTTRPVFDNTWHHIVWTDANGQAKMYVDGVLDETDYTYFRPTNITLNLTYIGVTARTTAGNVPAPVTPYTGYIDEVATWSRVLTWTEIQQIHTNGVPIPTETLIPPTILSQPKDRTNSVFPGDNVIFSVSADGTPPFSYFWRKGGIPIDTNFNPTASADTLLLTNVQVADSNTTYSVVITNVVGSITSSVARLYVNPRIAVTNGEVFRVDVGLGGSPNPQPGWQEFNNLLNPASFGQGATIQITPIGTTLMDRNRTAAPWVVNSPPLMSQAQIYNDFIFANDSAVNGTGLDILISNLASNTAYGVTIWSFDPVSSSARVSDWTEISSGTPIVITNGYTFDGAVLPTVDYQYTFGALLTSSTNGTLEIQGLRNGGTSFGVFINAIRLVANPVATGITRSAVVGGNLRLVTESEYTGMAPNIEQATSITGPWVPAIGGTPVTGVGPIVVIDFPIDPTTNMFYRGKRKPL
jgi:hypothetical protein